MRVAATPGLREKRRLTGVEVEEGAIRQQVGIAGVAAVLPSRRRRGGRRGRGDPWQHHGERRNQGRPAAVPGGIGDHRVRISEPEL
jgi:hypothetical protein